jgi:flagellar hook-associated protein 1 FlgK
MSQVAEARQTYAAAGILGPQTVSPVGYLDQITSNLATVLNDANSRQTFADQVNDQVSQLKGSVSGVNINEELSQMLVYQNGFQASSRIITVVNDLFDALISVMR